MMIRHDEDDREPVSLVLPLDQATRRWLTRLAQGNDEQAAEIVASMLHDIRVDDEMAHRNLH